MERAAAAAADAPIKFEAAGSRVFVIRRKLIKARVFESCRSERS
jgi:hypothetical protein